MAEIKDSFKKTYKMRALGQEGKNIVVSMPRIVVEREAEKREMTVGEFLERYRAIARFDGFDGVRYTFEPREELRNG